MADVQQHNESIRPHRRACCHGSLFEWLKLVTSASIPLMIGIVTIIITIQQQKVAQDNRDKDLTIAAEQRKQDLEIADRRRLEDMEQARLQRKEDMEVARQQREQDRNLSQYQREVDLRIAAERLAQDAALAEQQRHQTSEQHRYEMNVTYQQRMTDLAREDERYKEDILVGYQRDLAAILLQYGHTDLDRSESIARFALQMKTRTALRLLNSQRRTILVRSLYDANILNLNFASGSLPLLAVCNLSGVDFGSPRDVNLEEFIYPYKKLSAFGSDLRYASFRYVSMSKHDPDFSRSNLEGVDWSHSHLSIIRFEYITMMGAFFDYVRLDRVEFHQINLNEVSFQRLDSAKFCIIEKSTLEQSSWGHSIVEYLLVQNSSMKYSHLDNNSFHCSEFLNTDMHHIDFTGTSFNRTTFSNVNMTMCKMTDMIFLQSLLINVDMTGCTGFTVSNRQIIRGDSIILPNGTFVKRLNHDLFDNSLFKC